MDRRELRSNNFGTMPYDKFRATTKTASFLRDSRGSGRETTLGLPGKATWTGFMVSNSTFTQAVAAYSSIAEGGRSCIPKASC
jgi:hypothetical protein